MQDFFLERGGGGTIDLTMFSKFSRKEITEYYCDGPYLLLE